MIEPYYDDGMACIYHADCLDVLPTLSAVDLVVTSPPYNLGVNPKGVFGHWKDGDNSGGPVKGRKWDGGHNGRGVGYEAHRDAMPPTRYQAWQQTVLAACWETLSDTGAIFYNHKPRVQRDGIWTPLCLNPGLPIRQVITWARSGGVCFTTTAYVPTYEWIIVFAKPKWRLRTKGASGIGDVWRVSQQADPEHPAPFPLAIPAKAIETTGPSLVMDPFMGVGTTLRAAKEAGVRSIGIETSERYCEVAAKRLADAVSVRVGGDGRGERGLTAPMTTGDGWFDCCEHCGCRPDDRIGHDDTCRRGCNDEDLMASVRSAELAIYEADGGEPTVTERTD